MRLPSNAEGAAIACFGQGQDRRMLFGAGTRVPPQVPGLLYNRQPHQSVRVLGDVMSEVKSPALRQESKTLGTHHLYQGKVCS